MAVQILDGENKIRSVADFQNIITLTNKRLIFNNDFVGLNQLNSANLKIVKVDEEKFSRPNGVALRLWCIFLTMLVSFFVLVNMTHPYKLWDYFADLFFAVISGVIFGTVLAIPVMLIVVLYLNATSTVSDKAYLEIQKSDNSYFVNNYFEIDKYEELRVLENEINKHIFV